MSRQVSMYNSEKMTNHVDILPGYAFKSERFTDSSADIALVKGENVQQGFIDWKASKYWPIGEAEEYRKYDLKVGDIVLAMDRPWVTAGLKWAYITRNDPKALLVQRVARLRARPSLDQTYLRCLISSPYFSNYIEPIVTGVNVPHISGKQIGDFNIPFPPPPTQKKIAAILSAYDDLIENNKRRIALLEKMAEEIYREWFVRMRFPGHEKVKFVKGMPEGWKIARVKDFGRVITGKTPSTEIQGYYSGRFPFIKTPDMHGNIFIFHTEETLSQRGLDSQKKQILNQDAICVNCIGALSGSVSIATEICQTNQQINSLTLNDLKQREFLFFSLRSLKETIHLFGNTGSTMTNLSKGKFENLQIVEPADPIIDMYHTIVEPAFESMKFLGRQNIVAEQARNSLLPRLISGKLSIEDLDIYFPPSMQEQTATEQLELDFPHA